MIAGIDTHAQLKKLERGNEVIYHSLRTKVVFAIVRPAGSDWMGAGPETAFVVLQNGAVLSSDEYESGRIVRTFPAFGENTKLEF